MIYENPLTVHMSAHRGNVTYDPATATIDVPTNAKAAQVREAVTANVGGHGYVAFTYDHGMQSSDYAVSHGNMVVNTVRKAITPAGSRGVSVPMVDRFGGRNYLISPLYDPDAIERKASDKRVDARMERYGSTLAWQRHQAEVLGRFKDVFGLDDVHKANLEQPKRGLEEKDLGQFFTWRSNAPVSPGLMGDDMVGIPGITARDLTQDMQFKDASGNMLSGVTMALTTNSKSGIAIPMRNVEGDPVRFQIAADPTRINVRLKCRGADGTAVAGNEYYDKKSGVYKFAFGDGTPSELHVVRTSPKTDTVTFEDAHGSFDASLGDDLKETLAGRGYQLPDVIDSCKLQLDTKYIWLSAGDMCGSTDDKARTVSPPQAGIVRVREPKDGSADYTAVICEGALKGVIAGKYLDHPDSTGVSLADRLAGDKGVVLVQVPGVAKAFVTTAAPIYTDLKCADGRPAHVSQTLIAMDADGRKNLNVARGIESAEAALKKLNDEPVRVVSWDPEHKGLDDALLAVSRGETTIDGLNVTIGSAHELFPKDQAKAPTPLNLKGEHVKRSVPKRKGPSDDARRIGSMADVLAGHVSGVITPETLDKHADSASPRQRLKEVPPAYRTGKDRPLATGVPDGGSDGPDDAQPAE